MQSRYQEWLKFVFDRPETSSGWYFDLDDVDFEADSIEITQLVTQTFENCGRDLAEYSNAQVNHGLNYIFPNDCSNVVFALKDDSVPIQQRLEMISSIKTLYSDCLTPRCAQVLGHMNERGNPLNGICYMLWDTSPLSYWENSADRAIFYSAIVDTLEDALKSENPACVESALHGLGHIHSSHIDQVEKVISIYLRRNQFVSPGLKQYAQHALKSINTELEQVHLGVRFYPIGYLGIIGCHVKLSTPRQDRDREEAQHSVEMEIKTSYEELKVFGLRLIACLSRLFCCY